MTEITRVISGVHRGDPSSADQLLVLVYDELRQLAAARLAREKPGQTLQPTALVHEAYLRLVDNEQTLHWDSRGHFFGAAAVAMRRILVEQARRKQQLKRGGDRQREPLNDVEFECSLTPQELIALDEILDLLEKEDPAKARVVHLRFFAGLNHDEVAEVLGLAAITVRRHWRYARAWLRQKLREPDGDETLQPP